MTHLRCRSHGEQEVIGERVVAGVERVMQAGQGRRRRRAYGVGQVERVKAFGGGRLDLVEVAPGTTLRGAAVDRLDRPARDGEGIGMLEEEEPELAAELVLMTSHL